MPLAAYWKGVAALPLVCFLAVVVTLVWFILAPGIEAGPLPNTAVTLLGVLYIGLLGAYAALILQFPNGTGTFFTLILGTIAYDIGGLFVGSSAGRTPLVAWISDSASSRRTSLRTSSTRVASGGYSMPNSLHRRLLSTR